MSEQMIHSYEFGPFRLDTQQRLLLRDGKPVPLKLKAFDTLLLLVQNSGRILEKEDLMNRVWPDTVVEENNLSQNIFMLRKALGEGANGDKYIETVPKRGFRFVAPVREVREERADSGMQNRYDTSLPEQKSAPPSIAPSLVSPISLAPQPASASLRDRWLGTRLKPVLTGVVAVALLGLTVAAVYIWTRSPSKPAEISGAVRSLAVLPFKPLGVEKSDEYLGLGLADALITQLSNLRPITVRPTSSILKYTDPGQDLIQAGRQLGVDALLDGKIQQAGDRLRVTLQLVRVRDGTPLWAETFDTPWSDIFAVQDSIAQQVTQALMLKLTGEEQKRLTKPYTRNTEAYQLYLKGRYHLWNKWYEEGWQKALVCFQQAIEKDPGYAQAYAGLADSYSNGFFMGAPLPPREAMPKAKAAALKALAIDNQLAEAHAALAGLIFRYDWNWVGAEREYQRAIELNPNYAIAHGRYAIFLAAMTRHAEALAEVKRAQELEPASLTVNLYVGYVFDRTRQYDQAVEQYRKLIELDPNFPPARQYLAGVYEEKGLYDEAVAERLKAGTLRGDHPEAVATLRETYRVSGIRGFWQKQLDALKESSKQRYVRSYEIAGFYARLGETDQAFAWLEKAYEERHPALIMLKVASWWDGLRADPRFTDLLRRIGLPP